MNHHSNHYSKSDEIFDRYKIKVNEYINKYMQMAKDNPENINLVISKLNFFHKQLDELEILLPHRKQEIDIIESRIKLYVSKLENMDSNSGCIIV